MTRNCNDIDLKFLTQYNQNMPKKSDNPSEQFHGRFDRDVEPWAFLIMRFYDWSVSKMVNQAIRAFVKNADDKTKQAWIEHGNMPGANHTELEPPIAKSKRAA